MWQEILLRYGVDNFTANHAICSLHFKEDDIEKYRTEFKTGGLAYKVPLKRHALRYNAVPTIFPSEIKLKREYAVKLDDETLAKQREIFQASCAIDAAEDKPVKEKIVRKKVVKRKIANDSNTAEDPVLMAKLIKTNDLFETVLNAVKNNAKLSPYLGSGWVTNVAERNCIRWSIWKADLSGEEKVIILFADLTVNVSILQFKKSTCITIL